MAKRATGKVDVPGKPPVRKKYKKNFLKKVVVRVDFSDVKMELKGPAKAFIGAIKSRFPIAEVKKLIAALAVHRRQKKRGTEGPKKRMALPRERQGQIPGDRGRFSRDRNDRVQKLRVALRRISSRRSMR